MAKNTKFKDDNGDPIFVGDELQSKWGYKVLVIKDGNGYAGSLITEDKNKGINYCLNKGRGYTLINNNLYHRGLVTIVDSDQSYVKYNEFVERYNISDYAGEEFPADGALGIIQSRHRHLIHGNLWLYVILINGKNYILTHFGFAINERDMLLKNTYDILVKHHKELENMNFTNCCGEDYDIDYIKNRITDLLNI